MNLKQFLSYLFPITIKEVSSEINKNLEVTWYNGNLVLDSKNTNFSYGNLQKVMQFGLKQIGKEKVSNASNVLILGVAGGSVIKTLRKDFQNKGKITGVELDEQTITIANEYFGLKTVENLEIVITDAEDFVKKTPEKYDLIIIDIFQDNYMPDFLFTEEFLEDVLKISHQNTSVFFNSIVTLSSDFERNYQFEKIARNLFSSVSKFSKIEGDNEIFILCV
ncbi:spermidine synthase [Flavobacterium luminosum]|uniref:Fused MFS/spermidine synthase n=1 Tax=Flavobacterium luminosum TaxID=2949086 RepID=A0ABT0TQY9_9FLAO|nr:fused MFS/spermidine synthase [Flavobacterium sp. HXWNR70]MCL9809474.1 fused MFS/spermidine synthase [Flavobacterium sp. HXWNR70]